MPARHKLMLRWHHSVDPHRKQTEISIKCSTSNTIIYCAATGTCALRGIIDAVVTFLQLAAYAVKYVQVKM